MRRGVPLPSRLGDLGERHKLPQWGGRKQVLVHLELEGTHLVTISIEFVKCLRDIGLLKTPKEWEEMSYKCISHSQALIGAVKVPICHYLVANE